MVTVTTFPSPASCLSVTLAPATGLPPAEASTVPDTEKPDTVKGAARRREPAATSTSIEPGLTSNLVAAVW